MNLFLSRPLCFFDIESTGTDVARDRIISLAVKKFLPDGESHGLQFIVNPGMPIPAESSKIHGFTDDIVKDLPPFKTKAAPLFDFILACDLAGYNCLNFDVPLLYEEFARCGITWDLAGVRIIDVGNIFKKKEERTLEAAVKFYCHRQMEHAHNAVADVEATADVLDGQLTAYTDLAAMSVEKLAEFSRFDDRIDLAGKIVRNAQGEAVYNFGKVKDVRVIDDRGFGEWILRNDFTQNTKDVVRRILKGVQ